MEKEVFIDGIKIGDVVYTRAFIGPLTAGDALDAVEAGEKVSFGPDGPVLVESPARVNGERLRRNIKRLLSEDGKDLSGPMALIDLRRVSEGDYNLLVDAAMEMDELTAQKALDRNNPDKAAAEAGRFQKPDQTGNAALSDEGGAAHAGGDSGTADYRPVPGA